MKKAHEVEKIVAITEEIEASFKLITVGLKNLNEQTSSISNNHVPLQLLSSGFERVIKILLLLKTRKTSTRYKTPIYFASEKLKPKAYALYLLAEAETLKDK